MGKYNKIFPSTIILILCGIVFLTVGCNNRESRYNQSGNLTNETVKIGLLHSHTGVMAFSEMPVRDAEKLAVEEINDKGGVLGRKIEVVERDGASNDDTFASTAKKMIEEDRVKAIFGCWTSSSRKKVKAVVDESQAMLWYPLQYEGLEQPGNVVYFGQTPNAQVMPAVEYLVQHGKRRIFLIGSDYIFPRAANNILKKQLSSLGGQCVGEIYVSLNHGGFGKEIQQITEAKPDVIVNTLNGSSNVAFFAAYRHAGLQAAALPVMSFSISEPEIVAIGTANAKDHLICQGYFQTLKGERNAAFVKAYQETYGKRRRVGDAIESAYNAVYMWKAAAEKAGSFEAEPIKAALRDLEIETPEGYLMMDGETLHAYRRARIGRIGDDGLIHQLEVSDVIKPDPQLINSQWAAETKSE